MGAIRERVQSVDKTNQLVTIGHLADFRKELIETINQLITKGKSLPAKKWLKTTEVLKLLGVSPGKLQTMRKSGTIPYTRIGGSLYYDPEEINKMFEEGRVTDR